MKKLILLAVVLPILAILSCDLFLPQAAGTDGATWLTGTTVPSILLGADGDLYLNTSTGDIYIKTSGAWVPSGNIAGSAGADGSDGADATWLVGTTAPTSSQGIDGNLFINTSTGDIYIKVSGSWAFSGNIAGPAGADGSDGIAGSDGATGASGPAGPGMTSAVFTLTAVNESYNGSYYIITIPSSFFQDYGFWYDMWEITDTGWLSDLDALYNAVAIFFMIGVFDGSCLFYSPGSMIGDTLLFFRAPVS